MKRDGYVIEEIVNWGNLSEAFDTVLRGTERKRLGEGKWMLRHRDEFIRFVMEEIATGHIDLGKWHPKDIVEAGKERHLQVFSMRTRMKVGAVMIVVDKHLRPRYIRTTGASIRGRGMHDIKAQIERDLRTHPDLRYWYKFDVRKFYDTVNQDEVMKCVQRVFKDERVISLLDQFVRVLTKGISMGMRSSQGMGNLLLSMALDHPLKDQQRTKEDYRYCDDGAIGGKNKRELWGKRDFVHRQVASIGQEVKANERIFPVEDGIDFLGYVIYPDHTLLRKRVKKHLAKKLAEVKSRKRRKELLASLYGMAKHADCHHLMKKLMYPGEYKKYKRKMMKDFGKARCGQAVNPDGKKSFKGLKVSGRELNHQPFIVLDYEKGLIAKEDREKYEALVAEAIRNGTDVEAVPKPREKYIVSVVFQNQLRKFWTGDKGMWKELEERKAEGDMPFFCSMDADFSGPCPRYTLISATDLGFPMPTEQDIKRLNVNLNINIPL
jgi:hypothetical protein